MILIGRPEGGHKLPGPMSLIEDKLPELVPGLHRVARSWALTLGSGIQALGSGHWDPGSCLRKLRAPDSRLQALAPGSRL